MDTDGRRTKDHKMGDLRTLFARQASPVPSNAVLPVAAKSVSGLVRSNSASSVVGRQTAQTQHRHHPYARSQSQSALNSTTITTTTTTTTSSSSSSANSSGKPPLPIHPLFASKQRSSTLGGPRMGTLTGAAPKLNKLSHSIQSSNINSKQSSYGSLSTAANGDDDDSDFPIDLLVKKPPPKGSSLSTNSSSTSSLNSSRKSNETLSQSLPLATRATALPSSASTGAPKKVELSYEQRAVVSYVVDRRESVFYTGSAGTGKSLVMREIIRKLKKTLSREQIAITAPTGIAASNIDGCTLHSFAGCGLALEPAAQLVARILKNKKAAQRWRTTKVLIIDEISMVDADFFDKLEVIARNVRNIDKPFGGLQLIICGDFMQLPPVSKNNSVKFAFEAKSWKTCLQRTIVLKQVFRQSDSQFIRILNEIRTGTVTSETERVLASLSRPLPFTDIEPTELFALRNQVDEANKKRLDALPGQLYTFTSEDTGTTDKLKDQLAPHILHLKVDAQVMLIKNQKEDHQLVNGTMGKVRYFDDRGMPVVDFFVGQGGNLTRRIGMYNEDFTIEKGNVVEARRCQIPLVLAYALSIHKSQGQTIPLAKVDLGKVFEKGQAYVALSRATSLDTLQILNFKKDRIMADPKVINFNNSLFSISE